MRLSGRSWGNTLFRISMGRYPFVVSPAEPPLGKYQVALNKSLTDARPSTEFRTNGPKAHHERVDAKED